MNRLRIALKWIGVLTTIIMMVVLIGGALVTNTGSTLGCGHHWPLCNGKFFPDPLTLNSFIEWAHRFCTGIASAFVFILAIWSWISIGNKKETKFLVITSIIFLLLQAFLGAAAVVWGSSSIIMALHFGISLISFASVLLLTLLIFEVDQKFEASDLIIDKGMKWHTIGVTIYSYIVVYSGALVRHTNSSLVCRDWPLCLNNAPGLPANKFEWIQMGHRFAAGLIFIWIAYITYRAVKHYKHARVIYWGWILALIIVILQIFSGALVIFTSLSTVVALLHSFIISCLFGLLCYLILIIGRSKSA